MYAAESSLDYPAVGDWALVQLFNDDSFAIVHEILPRKTLLKRKTSGKKVDFQLIASNIDTALLIQSLDANFNPNRLERYIVMSVDGGIEPAILLSKTDLLSTDELNGKVSVQRWFPCHSEPVKDPMNAHRSDQVRASGGRDGVALFGSPWRPAGGRAA